MLRLLLPLILGLAACGGPNERAANREVLVYSSIDRPAIEQLIAVFEEQNAGVRVEYHSLTATEVSELFLQDRRLGRPGPDLLINSAMDLQVKLANDGLALSFIPPEVDQMPVWSHWRRRAYAIAVEPIVIGYHKSEDSRLPTALSRAELTAHLEEYRAVYSGRVGLYDPEDSSTGMLLLNQDLEADPANWELVRTIGTLRPQLYRSTREMIDDVSDGRLLLAYGIFGSYAFQHAAVDERFGVIMPSDYTLLTSRVALIPASAPNPAMAERLMTFLLSRQGQTLIAEQGMIPVRSDMANPYEELAGIRTRAITVGPALLANRDRMNSARFLRRWRATVGAQRP